MFFFKFISFKFQITLTSFVLPFGDAISVKSLKINDVAVWGVCGVFGVVWWAIGDCELKTLPLRSICLSVTKWVTSLAKKNSMDWKKKIKIKRNQKIKKSTETKTVSLTEYWGWLLWYHFFYLRQWFVVYRIWILLPLTVHFFFWIWMIKKRTFFSKLKFYL